MDMDYRERSESKPVKVRGAEFVVALRHLVGDHNLKYVSESDVEIYLSGVAEEFRSAFERATNNSSDNGVVEKLASEYSSARVQSNSGRMNQIYVKEFVSVAFDLSCFARIKGEDYRTFRNFANDGTTLIGIRPAIKFLAAVGDELQRGELSATERSKWEPIVKNIVRNKVGWRDSGVLSKIWPTARAVEAQERGGTVTEALYVPAMETTVSENAPVAKVA